MFVFQGLEMGAVDILIVWENLEIDRINLKNHQTDGKPGSVVTSKLSFANFCVFCLVEANPAQCPNFKNPSDVKTTFAFIMFKR